MDNGQISQISCHDWWSDCLPIMKAKFANRLDDRHASPFGHGDKAKRVAESPCRVGGDITIAGKKIVHSTTQLVIPTKRSARRDITIAGKKKFVHSTT
jgi:hypothetical protein